MQHDASRYRGHAALAGGLLDGKALQLHVLQQTTLAVGQTLQQPIEIGAQRALLRIIGRKESARVLQGHLHRPLAAPQMVNELVAGEGIRPGREGKRSVVTVALQMHCEECLLDEILDLGGGGADAPREIAAQIAAEHAEELTVSARIARQAADHQRPEALFGLILLQHWRVDSLPGRDARDSNAADPQTTNRPAASRAVAHYGSNSVSELPTDLTVSKDGRWLAVIYCANESGYVAVFAIDKYGHLTAEATSSPLGLPAFSGIAISEPAGARAGGDGGRGM